MVAFGGSLDRRSASQQAIRELNAGCGNCAGLLTGKIGVYEKSKNKLVIHDISVLGHKDTRRARCTLTTRQNVRDSFSFSPGGRMARQLFVLI